MDDHDMTDSIFSPESLSEFLDSHQTLPIPNQQTRSPFIRTKSCPPVGPVLEPARDQHIETTDFILDPQFLPDLGISPLTPNLTNTLQGLTPLRSRGSLSLDSFLRSARPSLSFPSIPQSARPSISFSRNTNGGGHVGLFGAVQDHTTLTLGMMAYIEQVEHQLVEMKRFLETGFKELQSGDEQKHQVESERLKARNYNTINVTEMYEEFKMLPKMNGEYSQKCPKNGHELTDMNHSKMNDLLDEYDLHFLPSMFLHEKVVIYLRFIGANRAVMHRILD